MGKNWQVFKMVMNEFNLVIITLGGISLQGSIPSFEGKLKTCLSKTYCSIKRYICK